VKLVSPQLTRNGLITHSINRLWILISKVSQVFDPSPQGVFRVVTFKVLVGRRTGPLTRRSLVLARSMSSWQTFSRDWTFRLVKVIRILWVFCRETNCQCMDAGELCVFWRGNVLGPRRSPSPCCKTFLQLGGPSRLERLSYSKVMKVIAVRCVAFALSMGGKFKMSKIWFVGRSLGIA
jgi:hypothetical protein